MTKTLINSRLFPNKNKIKVTPEPNVTKSTILPNLQIYKQKVLSGNGFLVYK